MSSDQVIRLLGAIAQLLGVLVWPVVLVFFLLRFGGALRDFLSNLGEFSLKAPGVEASAKRRREEAVASLGAAIAVREPATNALGEDPNPRAAAEALPSLRAQRRLAGSHILWVDDEPDNNRFERQTLEALGIEIDLSTSTEDAMEKMRRQSYDLVISDMGRPADPRAGYTLLDQLRNRGDRTPFIIYSSSRTSEQVKEARRHGAIGSTNSPKELITMVTRSLTARQ